MRDNGTQPSGAGPRPAAASQAASHDSSLPPGWSRPLPEKIARPTYWPAALAFGATLTLWGPVTTFVISAVGIAVSAMALIGWIREVRNG